MKQFTFLVTALLAAKIASPQITFQKTYGGIDNDDGYAAQQTFDGGYIVAGNTISFGTGYGDIYLIKTDSIGDTLWTRTFGGLKSCNDIQQSADSGYIITGYSIEAGLHPYSYLLKTDISGNLLWAKTFNGGDGNDSKALSVKQTFDGGYSLCGYKYNNGNNHLYVIKTDINGDTLWTRIINTDGGAHSFAQCADSGFVLVGGFSQSFFLKIDKTGNQLWAKYYGGNGTEYLNTVSQTFDGGSIIGGRTNAFGAGGYDACLIKLDNNGNIQWSKSYGGFSGEDCWSVRQTTDSGYVFAGITGSFGMGLSDIFLVKTNSNGNVLWAKTFGNNGNDWGFSVRQTHDGGYIVTGRSDSLGAGNYDIYLIKTDSNGNGGCNQTNPIIIENSASTQVSNFTETITFGGANTFPITVVGDGGIVNSLCSSVGIKQITKDNLFLISPNPSTGNFTISFERTIMKGNVEMLNILGENVFTENILNESKKEINLKNISNGIYFVKVFDGEKYYCKKIIIEHD